LAVGSPRSLTLTSDGSTAAAAIERAGKVDVALNSLSRYRKGKPVVVEETFPLKCTPTEYADFLRRSRGIASGWLAHFWSLAPEDLRGRTDAASGLTLESLNLFQSLNPNR
jgi:hypothetical protein